MTLWFVLALMTAAAIFVVLWGLARRIDPRSGGDIAVYRDQLAEIGRDRESGLIGAAEADAAQVEVSRRLLAAADSPQQAGTASTERRRMVAVAALVLLPAGSLLLYLALGSPFLPTMQTARSNVPLDYQSIETMVAQVEAHLERNPEDGRGWEVLAPVYMRMGRFDEAVKARGNALRLLGATATREADLGEAMTAAANGVVTADAKAAFERAAAADAADFKAQYFLGLAAEQDGKKDKAAEVWRKLLSTTPADAPWRDLIEQSLARVDPKGATPGPSGDDIAAADKLTPEQRTEMINGMVARLAARLQTDGSDLDAWLRLLRAYMVLGDRDKARAAAADARRAIGSDPDKQRRLDDAIKALDIPG